ncbi:MAG: efflux RND transporter permease subunit, partial [Candidatus Hydrogenedentales bacterium]
MDIIKFCITKPVAVLVGVILVFLFGYVSLTTLPYQLSPRISKPVISVRTIWPGATPYEIERDIIEEQEDVLKGLRGLYEMESESSDSAGFVTLTFDIGVELDEALLRVSNKLDEVPRYPENVEKPIISASGAETQPIIYLALQTTEDNDADIYTYLTFFENHIRQYLERVPGVSEIQLRGGTEREMQVILKPDRLAAYGLTVDQVISALRGENINVSAGSLNVGRWEFRVRAVSEFRAPRDIEDVTVISDGQRLVKIRDLADVQFGYEKRQGIGLQDGKPGIVLPVVAEPDANTLAVSDAVEEAIAELNAGILKNNGLEIRWLNDQRLYIEGAIDLLKNNILIGGA